MNVATPPRAHVMSGLDCWCGPTYRLPCDECTNGCWKCEGGVIVIDRATAAQSEARMVVHAEAWA